LLQDEEMAPAAVQGRRILVVEDDPTISDLLAYNLQRAGYDVRKERTGRGGLEAALAGAADLVLLDLMLPGLDGIAVSKEIKRQRPALPIIMLTARGERETMLSGFEAGADDYVTKPFDMDVLLARIQARLRTLTTGFLMAPPATATALFDITLDRDAHVVRGPHGSAALKPKEFDLLELLGSAPGHLFPREEIVERVWRHRYLPGSRSLDVHVRRLREKLESMGSTASLETVRGVGYRLTESNRGAVGV
jgi:DNA-binding response OmpR family regulator